MGVLPKITEKDGTVFVEGYRYELPKEHFDNPDLIFSLRMVLPNGSAAVFYRSQTWGSIPEARKEPSDLYLDLKI